MSETRKAYCNKCGRQCAYKSTFIAYTDGTQGNKKESNCCRAEIIFLTEKEATMAKHKIKATKKGLAQLEKQTKETKGVKDPNRVVLAISVKQAKLLIPVLQFSKGNTTAETQEVVNDIKKRLENMVAKRESGQ